MRPATRGRQVPLEYVFVLLGLMVVAGVFNPVCNDFLGSRTQDYTEVNTTRLTLTLVIYASALALAVLRWNRTKTVLTNNLLVVAVIMLPFVSLMWTVDPDTTLRRSLAHVLSGGFCIYLASTISLEDLFRRLTLVCLIGAIASFIYVAMAPDMALHVGGHNDASWRGVYGHKNELGRIASIGVILSLFAVDRSGLETSIRLSALAMSVLLLILSQSITNWLIVAALALVIPAAHWLRATRVSSGVRVSVFVLITLAGASVVASGIGPVLEAVGRDMTFSGRTTLWRGVEIIVAAKYPVLGAGYGAFFTPRGGLDDLAPYLSYWSGIPNHAHSGYLNTRANLGWPGLVLLGALILVSLYRVIGRLVSGERNRVWVGVFAFQFLFLVNGFSESSSFKHTDIAWMLLLILTCYAAPARAVAPAIRRRFVTGYSANQRRRARARA
ncbi:MAG: O-antigen polymerase [Brevundimonas sp.]|nr:O-antigen polymerase [Brevundimonas sp.]